MAGAEDLVPQLERDGASGLFKQDANGAYGPKETTINGYRVRQYVPRVDQAHIRIERWTAVQDPQDVHWRSISAENVTQIFGADDGSRIVSNSQDGVKRIFSWLLCESYDDKGDAIVYIYKAEDSENVPLSAACEQNRTDEARATNRYLKRIKYGNKKPNRDMQTWQVIQAATITEPIAWMFEVVFDYGEHDLDNPTPQETRTWDCRLDPLSKFSAAFEICTYRLCRRVLMFHHFSEELKRDSSLVQFSSFTYDESPKLTFLTAVTRTGCRYDGDDLIQRPMPPCQFEYSALPSLLDANIEDMPLESLVDVPSRSGYQFIDLGGEGLPGILTEIDGAWYYKRNRSANNKVVAADGSIKCAARFAESSALPIKPSASMQRDGAQLVDVAGTGTLDLLIDSGGVRGFFGRTLNHEWDAFRSFASFPNVNLADPNLKFVDLTGDGRADILITEDRVFTFYASLGEDGFADAEQIMLQLDEEQGPRVLFSDAESTIYLSNFSGGGLADIVRIRNQDISYWPSLGWGNYGCRVVMDNAPCLDRNGLFNSKNIHLTDVDGSGTSDIIYTTTASALVYYNQAGRSWSEAVQIDAFPDVDSITNVSAVDLLGNGTTCLVWTSSLPSYAQLPLRYVDLMSGEKPHLLTRVKANAGGETIIRYAPSTRFYLEDEDSGHPWITKLPFPVHVVEEIVSYDHVSQTQFTSRYAYHHGYYDTYEREFRGFAMVEEWDAARLGEQTEALGPVLNQAPEFDSPPGHIKSWFHTGFAPDQAEISTLMAQEYFGAPSRDDAGWSAFVATLLVDTILPKQELTGTELRSACRALKGVMLRQETYSDDGTEKQGIPYQVVESNHEIEFLQPEQSNDLPGVFIIHPRETLTYHYERNIEDPRIQHELVLEVDPFGNTKKSVMVTYGRLPGLSILEDAWLKKQEETIIHYTESEFTDLVDSAEARLNPIQCQTTLYEVTGITKSGPSYAFLDFTKNNFESLRKLKDIPFEAETNASKAQRRMLDRSRTLFRSNDLSRLLPLKTVESMKIPGRSFKLAFTPGLIKSAFVEPDTNEQLLLDPSPVMVGVASDQGGYVDLESDGNLWIPSGTLYYHSDPDVSAQTQLESARRNFFATKAHKDIFNYTTMVEHDQYQYMAVKVTDPLDNVFQGEYEYMYFVPITVQDPNGNRNMVTVDEYGDVVGHAVAGKTSGRVGDSFDDFVRHISNVDTDAFFANPTGPLAQKLLGSATSRVIHNRDRFFKERKPTYSATITRVRHVSDNVPTTLDVAFKYFDGTGRVIQAKIPAEPGPLKPGGAPVAERWIASQWSVLNNKGQVVQQFEPFFDNTHEFVSDRKEGVSAITFYDPLQRPIGNLQPCHTWSKTIFTAWREEKWDFLDTIKISDPRRDKDVGPYFSRLSDTAAFLPSWYDQRKSGGLGDAERVAAEKSFACAETPSVNHIDSSGRVFLTILDNGGDQKYPSYSNLDSQGRSRGSFDAKRRQISRRVYNLLGQAIREDQMDTGSVWMLSDAGGKSLRTWNSRGISTRYAYDEVRRLQQVHVQERFAEPKLVNRLVYGDRTESAATKNLRLKIFREYDQAGVHTNEEYDFKGNPLVSSRQFCRKYKELIDWTNSPELEQDVRSVRMTYDAVNRVIDQTEFDGSVTRYGYNIGGLLQTVDVPSKGSSADSPPVFKPYMIGTEYNAKGQRTSVTYQNQTTTTTEFDPATFRRTKIETKNKNGTLQSLNFTYDAAGNTTLINDAALQSLFFNNSRVDPKTEYTYDALYRLIEVAGREHLGQATSAPTSAFHDDEPQGPYQPGDGTAMATYRETYTFDEMNNILAMKHESSDPRGKNWTRKYTYAQDSAIEDRIFGNRLTSTEVNNSIEVCKYEGNAGKHGNMTAVGQLSKIDWDYQDHVKSTSRQIVSNGGVPETCWYVYDSHGTRLRKIVEAQAPAGEKPLRMKETVYSSSSEIFLKYDNTGERAVFERDMLHVGDKTGSFARIENRVLGDEVGIPASVTRYQICNHLSSVTIETDDAGQVASYEEFSPYGCSLFRNSTLDKRHRFAGKELDKESGLYYFGARYYAPWLGRWLSPDPGGTASGLNMYCYVNGNPGGFVDKGGTDGEDAQGGSWLSRGLKAGITNSIGDVFSVKGALKVAGMVAVGVAVAVILPEVAAVTATIGAGVAIVTTGIAVVNTISAVKDVVDNASVENKEKLATHVTEAVVGIASIAAMNVGGPKGGSGKIAETAKIANKHVSSLATKIEGGINALKSDGLKSAGGMLRSAGKAALERLDGVLGGGGGGQGQFAFAGISGGGSGGSIALSAATAEAQTALGTMMMMKAVTGGGGVGGAGKGGPAHNPSKLTKEEAGWLADAQDIVKQVDSEVQPLLEAQDFKALKALGAADHDLALIQEKPWLGLASKGNIMEDIVAKRILNHPVLRQVFEHVADKPGIFKGVAGRPDFRLNGKHMVELTTVKGVAAHLRRVGYNVAHFLTYVNPSK
jgi:RHS repeat-associated protein